MEASRKIFHKLNIFRSFFNEERLISKRKIFYERD